MKKGVLKFQLAQSFVSCVYQVEVVFSDVANVYQVEVVFLEVPNDSTFTVATHRLLQKSVDQFIIYELSYLFGKVFSQQTSNGRNAGSASNCSNYSINIFIPFLPYYPFTLFSYPLLKPNVRSRLLLSNISHKLLLIIWNYL